MHLRAGQASIEIVIMFVLAGVIVYILLNTGVTAMASQNEVMRLSQARKTVNDLVDAANSVWSQGTGAQQRVFAQIPEGTDFANTYAQNQTVNIRINTSSGWSDVSNLAFAQLSGTMPNVSGSYWLIVKAEPTFVSINIEGIIIGLQPTYFCWTSNDVSSFAGTFTNTTWNSTTNLIQIVPPAYTGLYTSDVKDATQTAQWNNITFNFNTSIPLEYTETSSGTPGLRELCYFNGATTCAVGTSTTANAVGLSYNGGLWGTQALTLNSVSDRLRYTLGSPDTYFNGSIGSLNVWFKPSSSAFWTDATANYYIIEVYYNNNNYLRIYHSPSSGGETRFELRAGGASSAITTQVTDTFGAEWHNFMMTWDYTNMNVYIDGSLIASTTGHGVFAYGSKYLAIGSNNAGSNATLGYFEQLSIYNSTLTSSDANYLYRKGISRNVTLQFRSCNDLGCVGESFVGPDNTAGTNYNSSGTVYNLGVADNQYAQFLTSFTSTSLNYSQQLFNVTVCYKVI